MTYVQWFMKTPFGRLYLTASEQGLSGVFWSKQKSRLLNSLDGNEPAAKILRQAVEQLEEYFAGRRKNFSLPFDVAGTAFQQRVWQELATIAYGKTISYQELAVRIQKQGAARAVGTANARNPLSIVVPCHRVIAADGGLGGYSGGLALKEKLLQLERQA